MPVAAVEKVVQSDGPGGAERRNEPTEDTTLESRVAGTVTGESGNGRNFRRAGVRVSQRRQQVSTVLGSGSLPVTDLVPVTVHGETDEVEFAVHDQPWVPNLLGRVELERFGLIERRSGKALVLAAQRGAVDEIRLAEKYKEQPPVLEEQSEDPFETQRQVFVEGTGHLDQSLRDELWNLLVAYRDVWENPKVACVKYEARFEASGKPYKARLRHLEPELRAELEKQVEKQLKLGVIRPSSGPPRRTS
ncbi:hypothetical protein GNI_165090 [Gregarina niphandrodes]|uniref:Uncharacterized protein n=1 Tax=Gregarina niphandrodes TaxID=110365 RepID=A0A023AYS3_GRENI|nr:hypothetical protein GNI_165090 [Gregarina niphandrodes]EZG43603.1 hypothetical protein GNI_165090 [Gregarina niphandrodes]|eukprot:XP_011133169.1 hypothetical protein GNI_165090 [Gregarina niphandrodes]